MSRHFDDLNLRFDTLYRIPEFRSGAEMYHFAVHYENSDLKLEPHELKQMWEQDRYGLLAKLPPLDDTDRELLLMEWSQSVKEFHIKTRNQLEEFMWNEFPEGEFFDIDEEGTILAYHGNIYKELKIPTKIRGIRVKAIGSSAFEGKGLIHVKLPVYLECIHERAFAHNLLEDFQAFPSLKQIKSKAFAHNYIFVLPPLEGVEVARDAFVNNDPPSIDAMIAYAMEGDGLRYPEKVEPLPVSLDANMLRH